MKTGIRVNELIGIELVDIRLKEGAIHIRNSKTYRERIVPIQKIMREQIEKYIAIRGIVESTSLFVTIDGTALTKRQVQNRISFYGKKARTISKASSRASRADFER